ncbi:MAG: MFS transporter [Candidatus Levybacteria bacterium]|nr:MFS transporter [Candidatus Levybacteria bacterium]
MKKLLYLCSFLVKGWEVSILLLLPYIQLQQQISIAQVGLLSAVLSVFQIFSNLFSGHFAEKFGNKKVISFALFVFGLAWLTIAVQANILLMILVYACAGIGVGLFNPLANSLVAKMADTNRGKAMGNFSAVTDVGRVIASSLTAFLLAAVSYKYLSLGYALVTFAIVILFFTIKQNFSKEKDKSELQKIKIVSLLRDKKYIYSILTGMCDSFASASLYIFIPLLLVPKGIDFTTTGVLTALFFAGYMSGRLLLGRVADKHGFGRTLIVAEIAMALFILLLVVVKSVVLVAITIFLLGIFTRGTSPIIRAMVAEAVSEKERFDKAYSFYSFSVNSSSVISRPIFGFLAAIIGISSVFYLASFVCLVAIVPILQYTKLQKQ